MHGDSMRNYSSLLFHEVIGGGSTASMRHLKPASSSRAENCEAAARPPELHQAQLC